MKRLLAALGLGTLMLGPVSSQEAPPAPEPTTHVTVADARKLALAALAEGRHDLAGQLALTILQRDPEDSFAHLVMATVLMQAGNLAEAAPAAKLAFRHAETPRQTHEAARIAALTAARQERFLPAQVWMRRAVQAAPDAASRNRAIREFKAYRGKAKLRFNLSGSLVPSSNVNNGAADRINVVDGIPLVGLLDPASQALPGMIGTLSGRFSYRLHRDETSETRATGSAQLRRVWLTGEARDKAPEARDEDYGSTYAEAGLSHVRALGDSALLAAHLSFGQLWSAGDHAYDVFGAGARLVLPSEAGVTLTFSASHQRRFNDASGLADVTTEGLGLGLSKALGNGDRLALSLDVSRARSDNGQARSRGRQARLSYDRGKPVGPVSLSGALTLSETTYPDYRILFFEVPGGRVDTRKEAEVTMRFDRIGYGGFVPTLTLSATQTDSNVSRFETEELSVSVGFRSAF